LKQDALYAARAELAQLRAKKLAGELCYVRDFTNAFVELIGHMSAGAVPIPARCTRDIALRGRIEKELDLWRHDAADYLEREAAELSGDFARACHSGLRCA
jgi:hypothetical protein